MQTALAPGDHLAGVYSGLPMEAIRPLGGGTQGAIWEVAFGGRHRAVKWYAAEYLPYDPGLGQRIHRLIQNGAPSPAFIWPIEAAQRPDGTGFGYVMPLLEPRFRRIGALLGRDIEPSYTTLCTAAIQLADQFLRLHTDGLCYRDISLDNLALDAASGDVCILDNDNVDIDGTSGPMKGTPLFIAPEVLREEAQPSSASDQHSLAVLLFYMFCFEHPLEGRRQLQIEYAASDRLYSHPLFIFDPDDTSNAPDPVAHANALASWDVYPTGLQRLFRRAFGPGLHHPGQRVPDSEWRRAMLALRDAIFCCPDCGVENFFDADRPGARRCWACGAALRTPPRLRIAGQSVVLSPGRRLFPYHLNPRGEFDLSRVQAEVDDTGAIRNHSTTSWRAYGPDGHTLDVRPGSSLAPGSWSRIVMGDAAADLSQ
jgi:serine/threonine protein kinase